jgi:hypothetical protein
MFHKHNWEIISNKTFKSPIERMRESNNAGFSVKNAYSDLYMGTSVVIVKCKCGKIKKFETKY